MFTQFHIHTHVASRLDGVASSEQYAEKAKLLGHPALGISEHGKLSSFFEHQKACRKFGIKAIFGVEAYLAEELETFEEKNGKQKRQRGKNHHLILIAKNETGYKNLLKLNYISMADEEHFYYVNRVTIDEIIKYKDGLIVSTGCMNSPINRRILEGKFEEAEKYFLRLKKEFGEDFYGEIQLNEFTHELGDGEQEEINKYIIGFCTKHNVKIIVGGDVHYAEPGQDELQTMSIAIRNKSTLADLDWEIESKNLYYHDIADYIKFNEEFGYNYKKSAILEWCNNTQEIVAKCNYEIPERNRMYLPQLTEDDDAELINKSKEGLCKIFEVDTIKELPEEYQKRLSYELEIMIRKGFSSYLLILEDVFHFIEDNGFYRGPARGSAAGSLVCYALNITSIDPLKYGLIFERFMSDQRNLDVVTNYFGE